MLKYISKRLMMMIPVILGVIFIIVLIMSFIPGDPARQLLGEKAPQVAVDALREELGINDPVLVRYVNYIYDGLHGDFGKSYLTKQPVIKSIIERFPTTLILASFSLVLAIIIGVPIGILSAVKQYTILDGVSMVVALVFASIPGFWLGLMLLIIFALNLRWFPSFGTDTFLGFVLPIITLSMASSATLLRLTRSMMLEVIRQDYIRTARSKGASERVVIFTHALKNALMPVITVVGTNFAYLLGGAIVIESVFSIPGLGTLTLNAIRMRDMPVVTGAVLFLAIIFSILNLLVDLLYFYVDPRLKSQYK